MEKVEFISVSKIFLVSILYNGEQSPILGFFIMN